MKSDRPFNKVGDEGLAKRNYHSPELRIFGDIRSITTMMPPIGMADDQGILPNNKTR
jgi:hypothetical protein